MFESLKKAPEYETVFLDHETIQLRAKNGKEITFKLAQSASYDRLVNSLKGSMFKLDTFVASKFVPMEILEPNSEVYSKVEKTNPNTNEGVTGEWKDEELERMFGVPAGEVKKMLEFARQKIVQDIRSRVRKGKTT